MTVSAQQTSRIASSNAGDISLSELENTTLDLESGLDENRSEDPPRNTLSGCYRWFHSNDRTRHIWSLRQTFFIVAGGIAAKTPYLKQPSVTITPAGALELARMGVLSPLPHLTLDDKTKADPITKSLVCVQAGWFIVQCIARLTTDLPITLFEIHTLAHVLVAFCMYLLWFSKPYNALSPVTL